MKVTQGDMPLRSAVFPEGHLNSLQPWCLPGEGRRFCPSHSVSQIHPVNRGKAAHLQWSTLGFQSCLHPFQATWLGQMLDLASFFIWKMKVILEFMLLLKNSIKLPLLIKSKSLLNNFLSFLHGRRYSHGLWSGGRVASLRAGKAWRTSEQPPLWRPHCQGCPATSHFAPIPFSLLFQGAISCSPFEVL